MKTRIVFQQDTAHLDDGWLSESGQPYQERSGGLHYGWSRVHTAQMATAQAHVPSARARAPAAGCRILAGSIWELMVDNGVHEVVVSVGSANEPTVNTINIENVNLTYAHSLPAGEYVEIRNRVWVTDGRLTLDAGTSLESSTCINSIVVDLVEARALPEVEDLPRIEGLPPLLQMRDGEAVQTLEQWETKRKPEIRKLIEHYVWGYFPAPPPTRAKVTQVDTNALGGKATCKTVQIDLLLPDGSFYSLTMPLFIPNGAKQKSPVILQVASKPEGGFQNAFGAGHWNLIEFTIDAGYAYAAYDVHQIDPDDEDLENGIHHAYAGFAPGDTDTRWGTIGAWAWGASRIVDYLVTDDDIDGEKITVTGHSRAGRTAWLAAAMDDRISIVNPHQGGTCAMRDHWWYKTHSFDEFYYWRNGNSRKIYNDLARLPVDMHCVFALIAPRPLLSNIGLHDTNGDYRSTYRMMTEASKVYELYGVDGVVGVSYGSMIPNNSYGRLFQFRLHHWHWLNAEFRQASIDFANLHYYGDHSVPEGICDAEDGALCHVGGDSGYRGHTGSGYIELAGGQGDSVSLATWSPGKGMRHAWLRYMCDGPMTISITDQTHGSDSVVLELEGAGFGHNMWVESRVPLQLGAGTTRLEIATRAAGKLLIDHLRVESKIIYQAEDGLLCGCQTATWFEGYTGAGFVAHFESRGDSITLNISPGEGTGVVTLRYMCNDTLYNQKMCTKRISLVLNGRMIAANHDLVGFSYGDHLWFEDSSITADFRAGDNELQIIKANDGGELLVDHVAISPVSSP